MINDPRTQQRGSELLPPLLKPPGQKSRKLGPIESFLFSALAPSFAVIFTNPFDTIKVRLQLQGESEAARARAPLPTPGIIPQTASSTAKPPPSSNRIVYKHSFDALQKIWRLEGIKGLQKGLAPAILREGSKNLFRIGMYDPILSTIHPDQTSAPIWKRIVAGSLCGAMGALSCNPFELVKTRLQSSAETSIAVGHQHNYTGVWDGIRDIYRKGGLGGLYKGSGLSVARSMVGSGANLSSYSLCKETLILNQGFKDGTLVDMIAGLSSGLISCMCMNPIDVVRTRYYNQPFKDGKGMKYPSGISAAATIFHSEGPQAFYKGFLTHFLRIGPHFCLTFVFLGILRRSTADYYSWLDLKDAFEVLDTNSDGFLTRHDIKIIIKKVIHESHDDATIESYQSRIFAKADRNGDASISLQEFPDMIVEVDKILKEETSKRKAKLKVPEFGD